ncbi:MAG: hypothetical protein QOJ02_4265 [Acidobacteriota bacterium]|jgi:hypothetical protein|nr:hypothetical protein [Acidobacteriota bacterium]
MSSEPQQNLTTDDLKETGLKILIIEDIEEAAERLELTIKRTLKSAEIERQSDFDQALTDMLPPRSFEAVILDLYLGDPTAGDNKEGQKVWEEIWKKKFVPVIIYTGGECDLEPPLPKDNPFVTCITKGENSDEKVAEYLLTIRPYMFALRDVEEELNMVIRSILAKTSPVIWQSTEGDQQKRSELLVRSARRRLAATMDMKTASTDESLLSWEQYIHPPLEDCLLTGDIIQAKDSPSKEPTSFRVVLTPSCDMQMNKGVCKVKNILVAKCTDISEYTNVVISNFKVKAKDLPEKLPRYLSESHQGGFIPLPEFKLILPCMAADLRNLELIPVSDIGLEKESHAPFNRIVSVDSPFREYMTWAYLQIVGRPGMPDRDLTKWAQDIVATEGEKASAPQTVKEAQASTQSSATDIFTETEATSVKVKESQNQTSDDLVSNTDIRQETTQVDNAPNEAQLKEASANGKDAESE